MAAALKHSKQGKRGDPPPLSAISTENVGLAPSPSKKPSTVPTAFMQNPGREVMCGVKEETKEEEEESDPIIAGE